MGREGPGKGNGQGHACWRAQSCWTGGLCPGTPSLSPVKAAAKRNLAWLEPGYLATPGGTRMHPSPIPLRLLLCSPNTERDLTHSAHAGSLAEMSPTQPTRPHRPWVEAAGKWEPFLYLAGERPGLPTEDTEAASGPDVCAAFAQRKE